MLPGVKTNIPTNMKGLREPHFALWESFESTTWWVCEFVTFDLRPCLTPAGTGTTGSLRTLLSRTRTLCSSGTSWQPGWHLSSCLRSVLAISLTNNARQRDVCVIGFLDIIPLMRLIFLSVSMTLLPKLCSNLLSSEKQITFSVFLITSNLSHRTFTPHYWFLAMFVI